MLEVIGAGFGRTGTLSLKLALEQLGLDPCYHMSEVAAPRPGHNDGHFDAWHDFAVAGADTNRAAGGGLDPIAADVRVRPTSRRSKRARC